MLVSNKPIKVADLQKLTNQLMQNGGLVIEMASNSFSESKNNFGRLIKRRTFNQNKNKDLKSSEKYNLLDFTEYLCFSKVQNEQQNC